MVVRLLLRAQGRRIDVLAFASDLRALRVVEHLHEPHISPPENNACAFLALRTMLPEPPRPVVYTSCLIVGVTKSLGVLLDC